jgi:putative transcriptional regulator
MDLAPGVLLVAEPALLDPNFRRAVILLCAHNDEGSFGLVLNRPTEHHLGEVLTEPVGIDAALFLGGPVQTDTLHYLHPYADEVDEAVAVLDGVGWGGPFEEIVGRVRLGALDAAGFRFFVGYSGWGAGQLAEEVEEGGWLVLPGSAADVFGGDPTALWREVMRGLGGEYALLSNYPDDPQMN